MGRSSPQSSPTGDIRQGSAATRARGAGGGARRSNTAFLLGWFAGLTICALRELRRTHHKIAAEHTATQLARTMKDTNG